MNKIICNNDHKFGLYVKQENGFNRTCKCCQKKETYPKTDEFIEEYQKQEQTAKLLNCILNQEIHLIQSSDNFTTLISIIIDNLSRLDITETTQTEFLEKTNRLNAYFNRENEQKHTLINNGLDFIKLYFKREKLEIKNGKKSLTTEQNDEFYDNWNTISAIFNKYTSKIYDLETQKKSSTK